MRSRAIYTTDTTSYVKVDEIYNDTTGAFDADNVNALLKYITGDADITYETAMDTLNEMTSTSNDNNATTSADIRSKSVTVNGVAKSSSQDVIVRFGGLDWQVVYLSKTTEEAGEDIILTLWLSSSQQDAFAGRTSTEGAYYGFINNSLYSDWSNDRASNNYNNSYPDNMYGCSYIRSVTLNNGGEYSTSRYSAMTVMQNENSVFARFTMEEVEGSLTKYITTPSKMSWQIYQGTAATNPNQSYYRPNDSIEDPADKGLEGSWYNSYMNYENKDGYKDWANDYIWLPSIAETGYDTSNIGLWKTSTEQRQNISFSDSQITPGVGSSNYNYGTYVYNRSWLRSGHNSSTYRAYNLRSSGDDYSYNPVNYSYAVRPALHLNLNEVLSDTRYITSVDVEEIYDENVGKMSEENVSALVEFIVGKKGVDVTSRETLEQLEVLAEGVLTSADLRSVNNGLEIKVTLGGLDWWATYLSTDTDGNVILTLWLDEKSQDSFLGRSQVEGAYYGYINGRLYSDWSADWSNVEEPGDYPSDMYGTSYVHAVTLNNGGNYAVSNSQLIAYVKNENSAFARFTMNDVEDSLTKYLSKPEKMSWQLYQGRAEMDIEGGFWYAPNDSLMDPTNVVGNYTYNANKNYHAKEGYDSWADDYLWLPSLTETGSSDFSTYVSGLWKLSNVSRGSFYGIDSFEEGVGFDNTNTGYRSGQYPYLRSSIFGVSCGAARVLLSDEGYGNTSVNYSNNIRPAMHLNLSAVLREIMGVYEVFFDNNGGEIYNGGLEHIFVSSDGFYFDYDLIETITKLSVTPTRVGYNFAGYFTEKADGIKVVDANGSILSSPSIFTESTTLFAHWEARNPAYYDSEGGYWYVENGKLPQSKVSDSLKSTLSGQWSSLSDGSVYYMGVEELANSEFANDGGMQSKVYGGNEYVKFNGEYYLVEPIRWRLVYSSSQQEGYAVENTSVLATMAEIVFLGSYSSAKIGAGEGYSAESVTMLLKNQVSDDYLVSESREVEIFGAPKDTISVSGSVFVASCEELANFTTNKNNTTGSGVKPGKVSFSDFVRDYLRATGQGYYYFTRDLGDQLNTIRCLNPVGDRSQAKAQQTLGVQFTVKVTEFAM